MANGPQMRQRKSSEFNADDADLVPECGLHQAFRCYILLLLSTRPSISGGRFLVRPDYLDLHLLTADLGLTERVDDAGGLTLRDLDEGGAVEDVDRADCL